MNSEAQPSPDSNIHDSSSNDPVETQNQADIESPNESVETAQATSATEKKYEVELVGDYDKDGSLRLEPYLTNEVRDALNEGHRIKFDSITSVEGALRILEDQLKQPRTAAGNNRELLNRVASEEKKQIIQGRLEENKKEIAKLAKLKSRLKKLLINKVDPDINTSS